MANLDTSRRHYDAPISGFLADGAQDANLFLGRKGAAPEVPVSAGEFKGTAWSMPLATYAGHGALISNNGFVFNPSGPYPRPFTGYKPTETSYECKHHGAAWDVSLVDIEHAEKFPIAPHEQYAGIVGRNLELEFEYDLLNNAVYSTSNWADVAVTALTGGGQVAWNAAGSTPIKDGRAMQELIRARCGFYGDYGFVTHDVLLTLSTHPHTLRVLGDPTKGVAVVDGMVVDDQAVLALYAKLWRLKYGLFSSEAMYNTADPLAAMSLGEMASGKVWIGCKAGVQGAMTGQSGGTTGIMLGSGPVSFMVAREKAIFGKRWRTDEPDAEHGAGIQAYSFVFPSDMADTAELLTGVNG